MKSLTTRSFREAFRELPTDVQERTRKAYRLFRQNPSHPGLNFKKIDEERNLYSARVGLGYRVIGRMDGPSIIWFWIGPHDAYDKRI
jgi:hypothetical protein